MLMTDLLGLTLGLLALLWIITAKGFKLRVGFAVDGPDLMIMMMMTIS